MMAESSEEKAALPTDTPLDPFITITHRKMEASAKKKKVRWCSTDKAATGRQACITEGDWEIIGQLVGENTPPERQFGQGTRMDRWMERKNSRRRVSEVQEDCPVTPRSLCYFR